MPTSENTAAVALREQAGRAAILERTLTPSIASDPSTTAEAAPACNLDTFQTWRWQALDPARPERRLTLFQRLYAWLYDYNRY